MEISDFIQHFAGQFEETPVDMFTADTLFRDLEEWSSMLALMEMAMVNEKYDVCLSAQDMTDANTIQDIFNTVQSKLR